MNIVARSTAWARVTAENVARRWLDGTGHRRRHRRTSLLRRVLMEKCGEVDGRRGGVLDS
jgi:hypothetical protein